MSKFTPVAIVLISFALQSPASHAQDQKSKTVLFHVTSVQQLEDSTGCEAGQCRTVRYKVEGFATTNQDPAATSYVLTCDELFYLHPRPHRSNICARFHAGSAYTAQLMSDRISFPSSGLNKAFETDYTIVSEIMLPTNPSLGVQGPSEPREATKAPAPKESPKGPEQLASKTAH